MRKLTSREALLIWIAVPGLALLLTFQLLIHPARASRDQSLSDLAKFNRLSALLDQAPDLRQTTRPTGEPLAQQVLDLADGEGLAIQRLAPEAGALAVSPADADFQALVAWAAALSDNGIRILAVDIRDQPAPGVVSARFLLEGQP